MTTKKKPATKRPRGSIKPLKLSGPQGLKRFLKSFVPTVLVTFGLVTAALNPQWREEVLNQPWLADLDWSRLQIPSIGWSLDQTIIQGNNATRFTQCPQFFPEELIPSFPALPKHRELCFSAFAILHNGQTKTPTFVVERLNRTSLKQAQRQERTDKFYAEGRLPRAERAELEDYRGSGYSRGHLAPAADMPSPEAMDQSFSLANMVPQNQTHNAGAWSQIEQDTRKYVQRARGDVYIFTGPVYSARPATIGPGRVAVPSHLFKLIYDASTGKAWAYWQANRATTQVSPPISYQEFRQRTGLPLLDHVLH